MPALRLSWAFPPVGSQLRPRPRVNRSGPFSFISSIWRDEELFGSELAGRELLALRAGEGGRWRVPGWDGSSREASAGSQSHNRNSTLRAGGESARPAHTFSPLASYTIKSAAFRIPTAFLTARSHRCHLALKPMADRISASRETKSRVQRDTNLHRGERVHGE